jgi:hypothetical protein
MPGAYEYGDLDHDTLSALSTEGYLGERLNLDLGGCLLHYPRKVGPSGVFQSSMGRMSLPTRYY